MSSDENKAIFMKSVQKWLEIQKNNADGSAYGFPDIVGVELQPYGTPYVS